MDKQQQKTPQLAKRKERLGLYLYVLPIASPIIEYQSFTPIAYFARVFSHGVMNRGKKPKINSRMRIPCWRSMTESPSLPLTIFHFLFFITWQLSRKTLDRLSRCTNTFLSGGFRHVSTSGERERERDRQTDRQTDRDRNRETETDRQTDRQRQRQRDRERKKKT